MSYTTHADLGGRPGFGSVVPEAEGERFHAAWEPRALALTLAVGATGSWNIDMSRAARETLPNYAELSYYEIWITALQKLLAERGLLLPDETAAGRALRAALPVKRVLRERDVAAALAAGSPTERPTAAAPRFGIGQRVRTRSETAAHHTRLPAYARGKVGVIERLHGTHVFADAHAQGRGEQPQWLYTVAFDSATLWRNGTSQALTVSIDAWDAYLEPA